MFGLILSPLLSLSSNRPFQGRMGCKGIERERKENEINKRLLHELPYTEVVQFCTNIQDKLLLVIPLVHTYDHLYMF